MHWHRLPWLGPLQRIGPKAAPVADDGGDKMMMEKARRKRPYESCPAMATISLVLRAFFPDAYYSLITMGCTVGGDRRMRLDDSQILIPGVQNAQGEQVMAGTTNSVPATIPPQVLCKSHPM
jgi:hypothetical protein